MLSLIRADVTDRRLPSANLLNIVTRPMAVLVSSREDGESGGGQPLRCSYCARRLLWQRISTEIRKKGLIVGKKRRAARAWEYSKERNRDKEKEGKKKKEKAKSDGKGKPK